MSSKDLMADQSVPTYVTKEPTTARPLTSLSFSRGTLVSSRSNFGGVKAALARPSTAVRAIGYAGNKNDFGTQRFNQVEEKAKQQKLSSNVGNTEATEDISSHIKYKNLEAKIMKLLESSIFLSSRRLPPQTFMNDTENASNVSGINSVLGEALNKAKEAYSLDRTLHRFRDQHGENIFHNFDLTYAVFFNLAEQYERNKMYIEALNTYNIMSKNKMFPNVNQLKVNMGNIYYKMGIFTKAIKMYRMALDSVPHNLKQLRLKITQNIGVLFVKMGHYVDAASSFEFMMSEHSDVRSGINLILCYYAMGDIAKIRSTFRNLCDMQSTETEIDLENENNIFNHQMNNRSTAAAEVVEIDHSGSNHSLIKRNSSAIMGTMPFAVSSDPATDKNMFILQALKNDELGTYAKECRIKEKRNIRRIIDLISPIIEENYHDGYNWCIEIIKTSNLSWLANELELNKALIYLRQNDVHQAIDTLKMHDKSSEGTMTATALINLSFIYINIRNLEMAAHCLEQLQDIGCLQSNVFALINASALDIINRHFSDARTKLQRALQIQPNNFKARYNLGLLSIQGDDLELAQEHFNTLKTRMLAMHSLQQRYVYYQIAKIHEQRHIRNSSLNNKLTSILQAYLQVLGLSASEIDSRLFEKVGLIYEKTQNQQKANQYYNEAYRINPSDIYIANSIGSYFIQIQATDKALYYYERSVLVNPNDPSIMLRVVSCFRKSYIPSKRFFDMLEKIYNRFPEDLTCLRGMVQVTKSLGMSDLHEKYLFEYIQLSNLQAGRQNEDVKHLSKNVSLQKKDPLTNYRVDDYYENVISSNHNGENKLLNSVNHHLDPLGPPTERPRTGNVLPSENYGSDEENINAESLLPI